MVTKEVDGLTAQVRARFDAKGVHFARRHGSDAMKLRHRQVRDEGFPFVGHDGELPVWFLMVRGELGEELVIGDSSRGRERGFVVNSFPYVLGGRPSCHSSPEIVGHVEVGFIKRERLNLLMDGRRGAARLSN